MPNYKEMYLTLFHATEAAISALITAQQACEELYINAPEGEWMVFPIEKETREK